jgi:hypothetical protein
MAHRFSPRGVLSLVASTTSVGTPHNAWHDGGLTSLSGVAVAAKAEAATPKPTETPADAGDASADESGDDAAGDQAATTESSGRMLTKSEKVRCSHPPRFSLTSPIESDGLLCTHVPIHAHAHGYARTSIAVVNFPEMRAITSWTQPSESCCSAVLVAL